MLRLTRLDGLLFLVSSGGLARQTIGPRILFACFDDLEGESLDYTSVADLPVWWSDDFRFSSNSEESPLHKLALSAVQAAHRRLDAFQEGALFPAQTSDRRRVARADRMCELEWKLLSHD